MACKRGRGGARHTAKPFTDEGVLLKVLGDHKELVKDLGPYESISRSGAVDPRGLLRCKDLLQDLLRAEPTAEVHTQPLRSALLRLMKADPSVNTTVFNGSVWTNLKAERLGCLLNHLRKFCRAEVEGKSNAASKLTAFEYLKLKELLDLYQDKEVPETGLLALEDREPPLKEGRLLKPKPSLDSEGFPTMFGESSSSEKAAEGIALKKAKASCSVSFLRRRAGQSLLDSAPEESSKHEEEADALKEAMGLHGKGAAARGSSTGKSKGRGRGRGKGKGKGKAKGPEKKPKEQPLKKPAASQPIPHNVGGWRAVRKTMAKKPARCYLTGTLGPAGKRVLITEVPER